MGSLGFLLRRRTRNMKLSLVVVAVILAVLISSCEGQKGGAKSAMRNGGRGGSGRGRGRTSMGRDNSGGRGQDDIFGNGTGRKSCVGLCYLRKLQGKPPLEEKKEQRRPCVGLCYREKLRKLRASKKN